MARGLRRKTSAFFLPFRLLGGAARFLGRALFRVLRIAVLPFRIVGKAIRLLWRILPRRWLGKALWAALRILLFPLVALWRMIVFPFRLRRAGRERFILVAVILATLGAGIIVWPAAWNTSADFLNPRVDSRLAWLGEKTGKEWVKNLPQKANLGKIDFPFLLGLDLQGGTQLVYEADLSSVASKDVAQTMQGLRDILERRVNALGVREPVVQLEETGGKQRILVELAGVKDVSAAIEAVGETPSLEFREQNDEEVRRMAEELGKSPDMTEEQRANLEAQLRAAGIGFVPADPPLTGRYLQRANVDFDPTTNVPVVALEFNAEGAEIFRKLTQKNVGKSLAIFINKDIISAPTVQQEISGGRAVITGTFTVDEAKRLARNLNAGALDAPINLVFQETVGPTLGQQSLGGYALGAFGVKEASFGEVTTRQIGPFAFGVSGVIGAGILGFLAVAVLMAGLYRLPGIAAIAALVIYTVLLLAVFKLFAVTLTLPGIAGLILSIGMAVDANILIFSRMREERVWGRPFASSVTEGFARAWTSIRDSNVSTLITTAILFFVGTSFIKGFALTLGVGVLLSMFTAVFVSRLLLKQFIDTKLTRIGWLW